MDNQAAIQGIQNGNTTGRNKYFRVRIDCLHDAVKCELIKPVYEKSADLSADALTKAISGPKLLKFKLKNNIRTVATVITGKAGVETHVSG